MGRTYDLVTSYAATTFSGLMGLMATPGGKKPDKPLELFEFEACPFCRKVRVALTALDLDALIKPCPRGGTRYRPEVERRGGRAMFPYLVDPNTGVSMYESGDIIRYLADTYGDGHAPLSLRLGPLTMMASAAASAARMGHGRAARPSKAPAAPLELYSFEGSPYSRLAREALCELELPYMLHNVGKGSAGRPAFRERAGRVMVPYLVDPNTGAQMFESADIVRYLHQTYGA